VDVPAYGLITGRHGHDHGRFSHSVECARQTTKRVHSNLAKDHIAVVHAHTHRCIVPILHWASISPYMSSSGPPVQHRFLWPTRSSLPSKRHLDRFSHSAQLTRVSGTHSRPRCVRHVSERSAAAYCVLAMRPEISYALVMLLKC